MPFLSHVWVAAAMLTADAPAADPPTVDALYDANRVHAIKSGATWIDGGLYDDIHLWRRDVGDHFEFRAIGTVMAPIDQVLTIILDQDHAQEWQDGSVECFIIEEKSFGNLITYNRNGAPVFFVSDRDGVTEFTTHMFPDARAVRVDVEGISDPRKPPRKDAVRMKLISGFWLLREIDATQTEVTYQLALNAGVHLPDFIVNLGARDVPAKTIKGLRKQIGKEEYKPYHARVLKKLDWTGFGLTSTASD